MQTTPLYNGFDFGLLNSNEFKEDAVREELINPILKLLGYKAYGTNKIVYSKTLAHPFVNIGSQKRPINIVPDYLFEINGKYSWVLDAKAPNEQISTGENLEQVYSYAIHPDINVNYFALCNGKEFALFKTNERNHILFFQLSEIDKHWEKIQQLLSPEAFIQEKILNEKRTHENDKKYFDYLNCKIPKEIKPKKQSAKRHFGVHGYFTRQSWDIVQHYIKNFTQPQDIVLDPFGGTGVTSIESLILGRSTIHIDLNPLSVFIVDALTAPIDLELLHKEFEKIKTKFTALYPNNDLEYNEILKNYPYPIQAIFMKDTPAKSVDQLFSKKQLAHLALLKSLIKKVKNKNIRKSLLLAFSSSINKFNLTFHYTKSEGGGDSAPFRYYRYRIAPHPGELNLMNIFETKCKKLVNAKKEIAPFINDQTIDRLKIVKGNACKLNGIDDESIDYIYTDPPYGKKITYLDLSVMWNAWLDFKVTEEDRKMEAIEGGSLQKTRDDYSELLAQSIKEMYRVLKFDRWLSFVFAHDDPFFWHVIVETAQNEGFEYAGAVKQANGQTSFKKRQNPFTVLSGQLIINFIKKRTPKAIQKLKLGNDIYDLIIETIESVIALHSGATLEQINDELIIKGLELGFLYILSKEYKDLTPILMNEFDYDTSAMKFYIRKNQQFKTKIPLDMRIRYFLIAYLRTKEREKVFPTTDDIILDVMPLLRNGITPENQTIMIVLKQIAQQFGQEQWKLKNEQGDLTLLF